MFDIMAAKKLRPTDLSRFLGISTSSVSNWKVRATDPPAEYLLLICEFIGVSIGELLGAPGDARESVSSSAGALARAAFLDGLTEEHISLIHCYCALTADEQAVVWDTITRLRRQKKWSCSDSPAGGGHSAPDATTA